MSVPRNKIENIFFRIIGIHKYVDEGGGSFDDDGDIHVPFTSFKRIFNSLSDVAQNCIFAALNF